MRRECSHRLLLRAEAGHWSLLAIFAHPDDEACGAGGTLACCAAEGAEVTLVCATRGEAASPCCLPEPVGPAEMGRIREGELRCSAAALGVTRVIILGLPDGQLRQHREALETALVRVIRQVRPQVVITFGLDDVGQTSLARHPDHVAVGQAALAAFRLAGQPDRYPEHLAACHFGYAQCRPEPSRRDGVAPWEPAALYQLVGPPAQGELEEVLEVDVTPFLLAKLKAMRCHRSQRGCWEGLLRERGEAGLRLEYFRKEVR